MLRLNRELNGGAWCPSTQLDNKNSGKEWIQVNFSEPYVITKVATQGRFGNGMGVEFAEQFWLHYTRDGINWIQWHNQYGEYVSAHQHFSLQTHAYILHAPICCTHYRNRANLT